MPTNPPCIGSWPLPPPEITPTLPFIGASLRTMICCSISTRSRSEWAASIPANASLTTSSGLLINFFINHSSRKHVTHTGSEAPCASLPLLFNQMTWEGICSIPLQFFRQRFVPPSHYERHQP